MSNSFGFARRRPRRSPIPATCSLALVSAALASALSCALASAADAAVAVPAHVAFAVPAHAAAEAPVPAPDGARPVVELLRPDGSLDLRTGYNGVVGLA